MLCCDFSIRLRSALLAVVLSLLCGCSDSALLSGDPVDIQRVIVVGTEQLDAPEVSRSGVFKPRFEFSLDSSDSSSVYGFFVTVASSDPEALSLRLANPRTGLVRPLSRLQAEIQSEVDAIALQQLAQSFAAQLADGQAGYWLLGRELHQGVWEQRIGVIIPADLIGASSRLDIYVTATAEGVILGGDHLELVDEFFYMAAIGDSAMWGNGLTSRDKFTSLVADQIQAETDRRVISQVHAISGAGIVDDAGTGDCIGLCSSEVPEALRSIMDQARNVQAPEAIDLILVDGCGNDVGLPVILAPEPDLELIDQLSEQFCHFAMIDLLLLVAERMPNARIVVTGYYPFISEESVIEDVEQFLIVQEIPFIKPEDIRPFLAGLALGSRQFMQASRAHLQGAVQVVNDLLGGQTVVDFADPQFGPENAAFASEPWLWGLRSNRELEEVLNLGIDVRLFPEDPLLDLRITACTGPDVVPDLISCIYGSVLHPNPAGARAYAGAIAEALGRLGILERAGSSMAPAVMNTGPSQPIVAANR